MAPPVDQITNTVFSHVGEHAADIGRPDPGFAHSAQSRTLQAHGHRQKAHREKGNRLSSGRASRPLEGAKEKKRAQAS